MDTSNDRGRVTKEISVVRTLARNKNRTITTKIPPSNNERCTLWIDDSMN
jgi:hypothetical protein